MTGQIKALLFDKDGTLFNFQASWSSYTRATIDTLSEGDPALAARLADALVFDLESGRFDPASPVIAGTLHATVAAMLPYLPAWDETSLSRHLRRTSGQAEMVPTVQLVPYLKGLRGKGLKLGVATNDAEASARKQLRAEGILEAFDFIAGYDTGFGAKPAPGMCRAFAEAMDLAPEHIAMIGDSLHDLNAGRAAGMMTIGVLTGPAPAEELRPMADLVLPDIGALPDWLERPATAPLA